MATRIEPTAKELYEEDFYVWAQNQAELLRAKRFDELDLANLIEEVEDLGGALERSVRSRAHHGASARTATLTGARSTLGLARHGPNATE